MQEILEKRGQSLGWEDPLKKGMLTNSSILARRIPWTEEPVLCLVAQSCLTLCHPIDCSPSGSSVHGDSPGKTTGVRCLALLQGIFPTQVSCIAGEFFTIWDTSETQEYWSGSLSFLKKIFLTQQLNRHLPHWSWILYQLRHQGSLPHV